MSRTVLYLHGFLSGPSSPKAVLLQAECRRRDVAFLAPDINEPPELVWPRLKRLASEVELAVVGSSLGGFYALKLAECYAVRAILVNPALQPWEHLAGFVGTHLTREGRFVEVKSEYARTFLSLKPNLPPDTSKLLVYLSEDDEVLDWRQSAAYFPRATQVRLKGEDHAVSGFARHVGRIVDFALG